MVYSIVIVLRDFNPRPREEGDGNTRGSAPYGRYFNPRPREEGDRLSPLGDGGRINFNPRPREEGDLVGASVAVFARIFQSTPS